jgi:hypothetical protein
VVSANECSWAHGALEIDLTQYLTYDLYVNVLACRDFCQSKVRGALTAANVT